MRVDEFDFTLPDDLVALHPAVPRDSARLLVVDPVKELQDRSVTELTDFLTEHDIMVVNNTKVLPAELVGTRTRGEAVAKISVNLHKRVDPHQWRAFARPAKKLAIGDQVEFLRKGVAPLTALVVEKADGGEVQLQFAEKGAELDEAIKARGAMPLPPYIGAKRAHEDQDDKDYQTIYAKHDGAVAAPTAGLHFTDRLLSAIRAKGVRVEEVTLHVGAGTFLPVKVEDTKDHKMHAEWGEVTPATIAAIHEAKAKGGRVFAVGTTSLRLLESASSTGELKPFCGETDIFITPGYQFNTVDGLMTNFHLPKSTLFMLVSAFSGYETMQKAYKHAIDSKYRFYSFGDASLLFRADLAAKDSK